MWFRALLLIIVLVPLHRGVAQAGERLRYAVYASGFNVLNIEASAEIAEQVYRVDLSYSTAGLLGTFFPSTIQSFAQGSWGVAGPDPARFASWGVVRGRNRRTVVDFIAGQPLLRELEPPTEEDREAVPPGAERDTIDTLSGMAFVVREVARSGQCSGRAKLYDGRRVLDVLARPFGREVLEPTSRSSFAGPTFRCDFEGRQTAGFLKDMPQAERERVHINRAWFAPLGPGRMAMPVRVDFEARFIGAATAYINQTPN